MIRSQDHVFKHQPPPIFFGMKISKLFSWEMGHRLMFHKGKCFNIHGHSYRACVEVEGPVGVEGMVMDFSNLKQKVSPLIDRMDHSFMIFSKDDLMSVFLSKSPFKVMRVDFETTAENIAGWMFAELKCSGLPVSKVTVWETETSSAECCGSSGE